MLRPRALWLAVLVLALGGRALGVSCSAGGVLTIVGDNRSADSTVDLIVSGERVASVGGCDATGLGLATSYATTVTCSGAGPGKCGRIPSLAPGVWIHHVGALVTGSALQLQTTTSVVVAGPGASNVVEWTVFGRTFVVNAATATAVRARLDEARAYTAMDPHPALVRFDATAFPGAADPKTIALQTSPSCALDTCADGRETAYCFEGARVVVDALDTDARPGGVVLSVGTCNNSLLRLYGTDNVWRGVVFQGTTDPMPAVAVDTLTIAGLASGGNRLEQCTVIGPTLGDAVSIEGDAAQPGAGPALENTIVASEIRGAEDKGIKVDFGGVASIERSCVHDNANGGIQATLGGTVTALENVIQHNVGGSAENGLFAGVPNPEDSQFANALATRGNVVRFNGARGISVVNHATATLIDDVVTDNYRAGLRVETGLAGVKPDVTVRGVLLACNYASGLCLSAMGRVCRVASECALGVCTQDNGSATGVGIALDQPCAGCDVPTIDLGIGGLGAGRNAVTLNANPNSSPPGGVNASSALVTATMVPARGNQWEHCDPPDPLAPNNCNVAQVAATDIRLSSGATALDLGTPTGPRHGPDPVVTEISPPRPRAGELVRIYGGPFNAIDGTACHAAGTLPGDLCSAENPDTVATNAGNPFLGNQVTVTVDGVPHDADVHQVTPTMLVFEMPVDCGGPGTLTVARGNDPVGPPIVLCDPAGCAGRPVGALCDDDDVCTVGEACQGDGTCGGGMLLDCGGACLTGVCDPALGCAARPSSAACDDGDACTVGDHCSGAGDVCVADGPVSCTGACLTGACQPATGCVPRDATASCDDANACTGGDHCTGTADACVGSPVDCDDGVECTADACDGTAGCTHVARPDGTPCADGDACHGSAACVAGGCAPGVAVSCDDGNACTDDACDLPAGCGHVTRTGFAGVACHVTQLRVLVAGLEDAPPSVRKGLEGRIDRADARSAAAEQAGERTRRRRKQARRAARCLSAVLSRVQLASALSADERTALSDEARAGRAALASYFGL